MGSVGKVGVDFSVEGKCSIVKQQRYLETV